MTASQATPQSHLSGPRRRQIEPPRRSHTILLRGLQTALMAHVGKALLLAEVRAAVALGGGRQQDAAGDADESGDEPATEHSHGLRYGQYRLIDHQFLPAFNGFRIFGAIAEKVPASETGGLISWGCPSIVGKRGAPWDGGELTASLLRISGIDHVEA